MLTIELQVLREISKQLHQKFGERIVCMYAFGSRVRGDFSASSDFDVLVVIRDKNPEIEYAIVSVIVDIEMQYNLSFTPLIKDEKAFELEKKYNSPFYNNIIHEGIQL